ncbi:MAG: Ig-like domain-containing protein, partial [Clostridia bacterium]|nr:Ig-like domain-containing protein [Clostridia bacterium]
MKKTKKLILFMLSAVCMGIMVFAVSINTFAATSMSKTKVSSIAVQTYTGKAIKPAVTVKYGSKTLKKGTNYTVTYSANTNPGYAKVTVKGKGSYTGTKTVKFQIVSPAVKNLAFSKSTKTSAVLSWSASKKATGYQVYKYTSGAYKLVSSVRTTSVTLSGLSAGSTYKVKVRPYNKLSSGEVITGKFCDPISVLTLPADIGTVKQTAVSSAAATVSWSKCTGASGYTVYSIAANGTKKALKSVSATSCKLTGLKGSTTIKVAAYRTINGAKKYSAESKALTVVVIPSGKVGGVSVSGINPTYATLKWTALPGCTYYAVYKSTDGVNYKRLATASKASYKAAGLLPCTVYFFKVCPTVKYSGTWHDSTVLSSALSFRTKPAALTGLAAKSITNKSLTLSWTKCAGVSGYEVYMGGKLYKSVTAASLKVSSLKESTSYSFKCRAYFEETNGIRTYGAWSDTVNVTTDDTKADSVTLSASTLTLYTEGTVSAALTATVLPSYAANKAVTWTTSNKKVAVVNESGLVTAKGAGKAVIKAVSAENNAVYASCTVTVKKAVTGIELERTAVTLSVNEKAALTYEVLPFEATDKSVTFTSTNTAVASVSEAGLITAKKAGTAKIAVISKDKATVKAFCTVTVKKYALTAISVPSTLTVYEGQTYTFLPDYSPSNASDKSFTVSITPKVIEKLYPQSDILKLHAKKYTYAAANYLKVNSAGTGITAVKSTSVKPASVVSGSYTYSAPAPESFTVTVTSADGAKTSSCTVTVIPKDKKIAVTGVSVFSYCNTWYPGKTGAMSASVTPSNATDGSVTWSSSNTNVAYVDAYGNVTAISPGTVTIKATSTDGKKTASRKITVLDRVKPRELTISRTEIRDLVAGDSISLTAQCIPDNANEPLIAWSSSNPSVANYYLGNVYGYNEGTAKITATTSNGISKTCIVNVHKEGVKITPATYFEGLAVGDTKQLSAEAYCKGLGKCDVNWASDNEAVAVVGTDGLVTVVGEGKAKITAYCVNHAELNASAGFTTGKYTAPDAKDKAAFLEEFKASLNRVKTEDCPGFTLNDTALVSSLTVSDFHVDGFIGTAAELLPGINMDETINEMLSDSIGDELSGNEIIMSHPVTNEDKTTYRNTLPVRGYTFAAADNLTVAEIKSCNATDMGAVQLLTLTLNDETVPSIPLISSGITTSHGKIFDIYYKEQIDELKNQISGSKSGVSMDYNDIATKYSGSYVRIAIDKYSGKVVS